MKYKIYNLIIIFTCLSIISSAGEANAQRWIGQNNNAVLAYGSVNLGITGISISYDENCNPVARYFYINPGSKSLGPALRTTRIEKRRSNYYWDIGSMRFSGDTLVIKSQNGGEVLMKASSSLIFRLENAK